MDGEALVDLGVELEESLAHGLVHHFEQVAAEIAPPVVQDHARAGQAVLERGQGLETAGVLPDELVGQEARGLDHEKVVLGFRHAHEDHVEIRLGALAPQCGPPWSRGAARVRSVSRTGSSWNSPSRESSPAGPCRNPRLRTRAPEGSCRETQRPDVAVHDVAFQGQAGPPALLGGLVPRQREQGDPLLEHAHAVVAAVPFMHAAVPLHPQLPGLEDAGKMLSDGSRTSPPRARAGNAGGEEPGAGRRSRPYTGFGAVPLPIYTAGSGHP